MWKTEKWAFIAFSLLIGNAGAATIEIELEPMDSQDNIICRLYNSPNRFGDLRESYRQEHFSPNPENIYRLSDIPEGTYAIAVFLDDNKNGFLDKNFIGIPQEPIAFSRGYEPKGPPHFKQAEFTLHPDKTHIERITLKPIPGKSGRFGIGMGIIARSSPYRNYSGNVIQFIPAVTYIGDRIQIVGPGIRASLPGSKKSRLAASLSYRMGVYEEKDSPALQGMGDRDSTAMAGLSLQTELVGGLEANLGYRHDILDRLNGGEAQISLSKTFQWGRARLTPSAGINWMSSELANYDYGVSQSQTQPGRPAYPLGNCWTPEIGFATSFEISQNWSITGRLGLGFLNADMRQSPIVSEGYVINGFFAMNYQF